MKDAWGLLRKLPVVLQAEETECGLASLAMVARYHGHDTDLAALRRRFSISRKGATLDALIRMARALEAEVKRDRALAKYHSFEFGSAAFQIAIVLASSYLITGVFYLLWGAGAVGAVGVLFTILGMVAPNALHIFGAH